MPQPAFVDGLEYARSWAPGEGENELPRLPYMERNAQVIEAEARARGADIIHAASFYTTGLPAIRAARRLGIPVVYEVRGLPHLTFLSRRPEYAASVEHTSDIAFEAQACTQADAVLTLNAAMRDELVALGVDAAKISLAPNSVDSERFRPLERDDLLAKQLDVDGKTVIGYVGSFVDYEGLDDLIAAFAGIASSQGDVALILVGDGTEERRIRRQVEELGLEDRIAMPGRLDHDQVTRYYSLIDVVVLPRKPLMVCEVVSPMKPFEAMAMGKALVVSSVAALAEIVSDGETGVVFEKGDPGSLELVLRDLIANENKRRYLGAQARRWVVEHRTWDALADRVTRVYESLRGG